MRSREYWKLPLLLCVVGAHLWLGWKLALYRPSEPRSPVAPRPSEGGPELLMVLDFASAPARPAARRSERAKQSRPARRGGDAPMSASCARAGRPDAELAGAQAPSALDLHLQVPAGESLRAPDPLHRRSALEFQSTRFDQAWMSDGDLKHVVARRSKVASMLLGALGALREPCTEARREQYDVDCVPDQYRHPGPGED